MTHRQFEAWLAWELDDLNTPSRDNWYQMAGIRMQTDKPSRYALGDFRIEFGDAEPAPPEDVEVTKKRWRAMMGKG